MARRAPSGWEARPSASQRDREYALSMLWIFLAGPLEGERYRLSDNDVVSPDRLMSALKRYLEESRDSEREVASQIGVNHHALRRLCDR
jgi:hypothetical protein